MRENFAFEAGEQYVVGGVGYHILKVLSAGQILVKNLMTGEETAHNRKELGKQWNEGALEFGRHGRNLRVVEGCPVKISYEFTDLDFLKVEPHSEELIQETWDKYELVRRLINLAPIVLEKKNPTSFSISLREKTEAGSPGKNRGTFLTFRAGRDIRRH